MVRVLGEDLLLSYETLLDCYRENKEIIDQNRALQCIFDFKFTSSILGDRSKTEVKNYGKSLFTPSFSPGVGWVRKVPRKASTITMSHVRVFLKNDVLVIVDAFFKIPLYSIFALLLCAKYGKLVCIFVIHDTRNSN